MGSKTVNIKINNREYTVPAGYTVLEAARSVGIDIPTLCFLEHVNEIGACRMCVVEVKGARSLVAACVYPVNEGLEVITNSRRVLESRRTTLELILSTHNKRCLSCDKSGNCELQNLCHQMGITNEEKYGGPINHFEEDHSSVHLVRDNSKCILCRRCVAACKNQHVGVIGANARGFDTSIGCAFEKPLDEVACVSCGQCIVACPTGALREKDETEKTFAALSDPTKHVVVFPAPSVRVTLGESFGMAPGTVVTGKMAAACHRIGFDAVFDTNFSADLTIMEEATEFLGRVKSGGPLPLITSCSPGWIRFVEQYYHEFLPNVSSCKSPQQMMGAMVKTYYAEKNGFDPKDIVTVSIMPCTAKKYEARREDQAAAGVPDVDIALTTRELAKMIMRTGINFEALEDEPFDSVLGQSSGAADIFGTSGGVMEAALRTAADILEGKDVDNVDYKEVRGTVGLKEAVYNVGGMEIKVAAVSGLSNVAKLLDDIKAGRKDYHFIEVMCCPGGCINGGGQPSQPAVVRNNVNLPAMRAAGLYREDAGKPLRKAHKNPSIIKVYEEYLGEPGSHKAHKILHTTYKARSKY